MRNFQAAFVSRVGEPEAPRHVAGFLAAVLVAGELSALVNEGVFHHLVAVLVFLVVAEHGEEELALRIPEFFLHLLLQLGGGAGVVDRPVDVAGEFGNLGEGPRVGPHVAVEAGAIARGAREDVLGLAAGNLELHPVVVAHLPEHSRLGNPRLARPGLEVLLQVGPEVGEESLVRVHEVGGPGRVRHPGRVAARLRAGSAKPIAGEVAAVARIVQPAHFVELVAGRTGDPPVGAGEDSRSDKSNHRDHSGHGRARGRLADHVEEWSRQGVDSAPGRLLCQ